MGYLRERQRWILADCQLLDAQISALLGIPAIASVSEAGVQLPSDEPPWEAADALSWWKAMQNVRGPDYGLPFMSVLSGVLDGRHVSTSDFGRSILGHTLYRYVLVYNKC